MASWGDFARTLATGRAAFDRVHGMTVWDWFEKHPDEREMFGLQDRLLAQGRQGRDRAREQDRRRRSDDRLLGAAGFEDEPTR